MTELTSVPRLAPRDPLCHKGSFGRVLIVAGSRGMSGAAVLCGTAALKCGAGLVTVACPDTIQPVVAAGFPCYTTVPLPDQDGHLSGDAVQQAALLAKQSDAIAIGPGLGTGAAMSMTVTELLRRVSHPVVLDADGLNAISPLNSNILKLRTSPTVLTPHPGEFARLTNAPPPVSEADRLAAAARFAATHHIVMVLKGHDSIVTDGEQFYINRTGNPGMATGGSGDVLTGMVAALIAQGLSAMQAAILAVHVHGLAGDLAAADRGQIGMTAMDILDRLAPALMELEKTPTGAS